MISFHLHSISMHNNDTLKSKHWAGFIKPETMQQESWFHVWLDTAITAEKNNSELAVFKIPNTNFAEYCRAISDIERLLQERFPNLQWEHNSRLSELMKERSNEQNQQM